MKISFYAPASIGNLGVGFDVLGMAVKPVDGSLLGDVVHLSANSAGENTLHVSGPFAAHLPKKATDNIVWHSLQMFNQRLREAGGQVQNLQMALEKNLPIGSGLGSSAASSVAAIAGLNTFYGNVFKERNLLEMMGEMEARISGSLHYDNAAPCFLGGVQLMLPGAGKICRPLPILRDCFWVMAYSGVNISTKKARDILPENYSRSETIRFGQQLAAFIDACHCQNREQAFRAFSDVIAEPWRAILLPGYAEAKEFLLHEGSLAVGISGSGPTLFSVARTLESAEDQAHWLRTNYSKTRDAFVHVCQGDEIGARQL
ncbi:MAG: homoserine kinase [Sphingomonadales bacterium]